MSRSRPYLTLIALVLLAVVVVIGGMTFVTLAANTNNHSINNYQAQSEDGKGARRRNITSA